MKKIVITIVLILSVLFVGCNNTTKVVSKAIIENIEKSRNVNLYRFINSLGIHLIGVATSKEISLNVKMKIISKIALRK